MADALVIYRWFEGRDDVQEFIDELQTKEEARLAARIDALKATGFALLGSNVLTDTTFPHIKEIVVNGRVAVRMLACRGPIDGRKELTLLFGAFERDNVYVPSNALAIADKRREAIINSPKDTNRKRIKHERKRRA